jgi:hypothetical protein
MSDRTTDWTVPMVQAEAVVVPRSDVSPLIVEAASTFEKELPELLKTHPRRWIAYFGAHRVAIADQEPDLLRACYADGYDDKDLYVRRIEEPIDVSLEW